MLVHLESSAPLSAYTLFELEYEEGLMERIDLESLPPDWSANPPPDATREIGDGWVEESRTAVLEVPSAIIPHERNYLVNPRHTDFAEIAIGDPTAFLVDPRLE